MLLKRFTQYVSKSGKLSSGHRTGNGQFSFQSQRKAMPKNAQTPGQLHSSHTLIILKILQARLRQYVNCELPDVQAGFRKGRGTRNKITNIHWIIKKAREFQKKPTSVYRLHQSLWLCGSQQTMKNSSREGNTRPPDLPPEKSVCRSRSNS